MATVGVFAPSPRRTRGLNPTRRPTRRAAPGRPHPRRRKRTCWPAQSRTRFARGSSAAWRRVPRRRRAQRQDAAPSRGPPMTARGEGAPRDGARRRANERCRHDRQRPRRGRHELDVTEIRQLLPQRGPDIAHRRRHEKSSLGVRLECARVRHAGVMCKRPSMIPCTRSANGCLQRAFGRRRKQRFTTTCHRRRTRAASRGRPSCFPS